MTPFLEGHSFAAEASIGKDDLLKRITQSQRLVVAIGAGLTLALSTCGAALADSPHETTTTTDTGTTLTGVSGGTEAQKLAWISAHPLLSTPSTSNAPTTSLVAGVQLAASTVTSSGLESKKIQNNVGNAYIEVDGTATLTTNDTTNYKDSFTYTNSDAEWLGTSPSTNCTWINPTEEWSVSGYSVSIGYPASVSIGGSSQDATWAPGHYNNVWQAPLEVQQAITFSSNISVYNPHYTTGATFLLGGQGYGLSGTGG